MQNRALLSILATAMLVAQGCSGGDGTRTGDGADTELIDALGGDVAVADGGTDTDDQPDAAEDTDDVLVTDASDAEPDSDADDIDVDSEGDVEAQPIRGVEIERPCQPAEFGRNHGGRRTVAATVAPGRCNPFGSVGLLSLRFSFIGSGPFPRCSPVVDTGTRRPRGCRTSPEVP